MDELHGQDYDIAKECKVTIKKKPSATAQWALPDKLDFDPFFFLAQSSAVTN